MSNNNDDDDDDNDAHYFRNDQAQHGEEVAPVLFRRARSIRTENTPSVRKRIPSPPIESRSRWRDAAGRNLLATEVRAGEPVVAVDGFDEYQREDGLSGPPQGRAGSADAFNVDYMKEYRRRLNLLEKDPNYRFVNIVRGFLGGNVFEVLEEDAFRQNIERDIARAKEEARKELTRAEAQNTLRREIVEREKEQKRVEAEIKTLEQKSKLWQDARTEFAQRQLRANRLLADNSSLSTTIDAATVKSVMSSRGIISRDQQMFDLMARVAFMKYGPRGLLNKGFAADVEQFFRSTMSKVMDFNNFQNLKTNVPQVFDTALYVAALKGLANSQGLLSVVAKSVKFPAGSMYATTPELFASDAAILSNMLTPDVGNGQASGPVTFKKISLLLHAHINAMVAKSGLPEDRKIVKPTQIVDSNQQKRTKSKKTIFGKEVDVNVDDETLQRAALGEPAVFTEQKLAEYQRTLFANSEWIKTMSIVQHLLMPLFQEGFGRMFFVDMSENPSDEERVYAESRYPVEKKSIVRAVFQDYRNTAGQTEFSVAQIFDIATFLLQLSDLDMSYNKSWYDDDAYKELSSIDHFAELLSRNSIASDWLRYELNLRNYVVKDLILPAAAKLMLLMNNNLTFRDRELTRPIVFSDADAAALENYLKLPPNASAKETESALNAVLDIFDNRVPFTRELAVRNNLSGIYTTPSNRSFRQIALDNVNDPVFPVPDQLEKTNAELLESIKKFRKKIAENLSKTPEQIQQEIIDNLGGGLRAVNRRWASMPFNSGILPLSSRFMSCLGDATNIVRRNCPNLSSLTDEQLQRHPLTEIDFGHLVANKILIVNAANPGQYLRDNTIPDVKVLVRDNVEALRRVDIRTHGISSLGKRSMSFENALPLQKKYGSHFR